jgi:hypothetical protein
LEQCAPAAQKAVTPMATTTSFPVTMPNAGAQMPTDFLRAPFSPAGPITPLTPNTGTWEAGAPPNSAGGGGVDDWGDNPVIAYLRSQGFNMPSKASLGLNGPWQPYDISSSAQPTDPRVGQQQPTAATGPITPLTPNTGTWQNGVPGISTGQPATSPALTGLPGMSNFPMTQPYSLPTPQLPGWGNQGGGGNMQTMGGQLGPNPSWGRSTMPWAS